MGDRAPFVLAGLLVAGAAIAGALVMRDADPPAIAEPAPLVSEAAKSYVMVAELHRTRGELPEIAGSAVVCIDPTGRVVSVAMPDELAATVRATATARISSWQFEPYVHDGEAVAACTYVELARRVQDVPLAEAPAPLCDEVSCVLDNYTGACCAQYKKTPTAPINTIGRAEISAAIAAIKSRVTACGDSTGLGGMVKVRVKVGADGSITSVDPQRDDALGRCVADAVRQAKFPKSDTGVSFSYPFVFGERPPVVKSDTGTLMLASKPPCSIYIDGANTKLVTPQRAIALSPGKHKVTLVNEEVGLKESFGVEIKAGTMTRVIKDYSDRQP